MAAGSAYSPRETQSVLRKAKKIDSGSDRLVHIRSYSAVFASHAVNLLPFGAQSYRAPGKRRDAELVDSESLMRFSTAETAAASEEEIAFGPPLSRYTA